MGISLLNRVSTYLFFISLLFLTIDMPLDSWWKVSIFTPCLFIGALTKNKLTFNNALLSLMICAIIMSLKTLIPLSYIEEGANVFVLKDPVFKKLPQPIYDHLEQEFKKYHIPSAITSDHKLYAFSVENFHQKSSLSRKKKFVHFTSIHDTRFGFMNKLNYNTYYEMKPKREHLPFFVRYDIPLELSGHKKTEICWKGDIFVQNQAAIYQKKSALTTRCLSTASENIHSFYGVSVNPEVPLSLSITLPLSQYIWMIIGGILSILGGLIITNILYPFKVFCHALKSEKDTQFKSILLLSSTLFSLVVAFYYRPYFSSGFLLFEGGNDALSYASMARVVLESLFTGDWLMALKGGEAVFDLMPLQRYTYALNLFLFGETHFGYFILVLFAPLSIYFLTWRLFNSKHCAFAFGLIFAIIPVFETFGFTQLYMVRLCLRGFAEPLSYIAFFTAIALGLPYLKKETFPSFDRSRLFFTGLCLAIAVGARPNVAPGAGIFLLCISYMLLKYRTNSFKNIGILSLGFVPVLLIPLHNYMFGDSFVIFTIAGQKIENLAVSIADYKALFQGVLNFNIPQEPFLKITEHLNKEIKPTKPWLYLVILLTTYGLCSKKLSFPGKAIALTGLGQLSIVLFYKVGGRYGYLHWSLLLLTSILVLKNLCNRHSRTNYFLTIPMIFKRWF